MKRTADKTAEINCRKSCREKLQTINPGRKIRMHLQRPYAGMQEKELGNYRESQQRQTAEENCRRHVERSTAEKNAENNCTEQLQRTNAKNSCRDLLQRKAAETVFTEKTCRGNLSVTECHILYSRSLIMHSNEKTAYSGECCAQTTYSGECSVQKT